MTCVRSVVFSGFATNKTDRRDITEILLKAALNTIAFAIKLILPSIMSEIYIRVIGGGGGGERAVFGI